MNIDEKMAAAAETDWGLPLALVDDALAAFGEGIRVAFMEELAAAIERYEAMGNSAYWDDRNA